MSRLSFSANLGFLWKELPLPDAIRAAAANGFNAVECHWPYDENEDAIGAALVETGLPMLGINTRCGEGDASLGYAALEGYKTEAISAIDEAINWASRNAVANVHVMAGKAQGREAFSTLVTNLRYACDKAEPFGITVLVEPLNPHDAAGYFCHTSDEAIDVINAVGAPNLKLMFDCYHVGRVEAKNTDGVLSRLAEVLPHVGHVQFAAVPDRGTPDHGEINFSALFDGIAALGWSKPLGAEYRVVGRTEDTLGWLIR